MSDFNFGCTFCGRCCKNHSLPLTLNEAVAWLEDDGQVAVFCEAHTAPRHGSLRTEHRRKRSFAVRCGSSQVCVTAIFVAIISGACKNLTEDLKCNIYERRPLVCRIYPAEISPFIQLDTAAKACPPEAWLANVPLQSQQLQQVVDESIQTDRNDAVQKMMICQELKIDVASVADEGFVAYYPERKRLLDVLRKARLGDWTIQAHLDYWGLYSPSKTTVESLSARGFEIVSQKRAADTYSFLQGASSPSLSA